MAGHTCTCSLREDSLVFVAGHLIGEYRRIESLENGLDFEKNNVEKSHVSAFYKIFRACVYRLLLLLAQQFSAEKKEGLDRVQCSNHIA